MAIDVKELISNAFLELCNEMPLKKIKVSDISNKCGVSRSAFYNHFYNKDELIQYIYMSRCIPNFIVPDNNIDYRTSLSLTFAAYDTYYDFMYAACKLDGDSNLGKFMIEHAKEWDTGYYQSLSDKPLSPSTRVVINYMAIASMQITVDWILGGRPVPNQEMVDLICRIRDICIKEMFDSDIAEKIAAASHTDN